ncbi:zf-C3HC4 zf-CCCH zinc finger [Cryptosporidium bovis]|uniref:zf-C3HC4 zf-CCCH zinc finger n=1 Tax=Cryptosporidium bovis TaxID=310047 RepID=UPI00351A131A|nr:zf-C3HC4 zf-CCCH zinc finger [Cryptosporidium bovis]
MFRKRNVNKDKTRSVHDVKGEEVGIDINGIKDSFNSDHTNIKFKKKEEKAHLITDINNLKGHLLNFSSENSIDDQIKNKTENEKATLISQKSNIKFSKDNYNILNNRDMTISNFDEYTDSDNTKNKYNKNIYTRRSFDTIESRNSNIKQTLVIDYQHDICKDYKETGYCGFGDTCKFLHDRSDFTSGWKLDREWNEQVKKKLKLNSGSNLCDNSNNEQENDNDKLPSYCFICKKKWVYNENCNPVVTLCKHYFCEKCAFSQYTKSSRCFQCNTPTRGTFNTAENVLAAIKSGIFDFEQDSEDGEYEDKSESEQERE